MNEENIVNALLEGAGLSTFIFHTHFCLEFDCNTNKMFCGKRLPLRVTLTILGDWWFGNKEEWDETVRKMTKGFQFVEPDEPVLAFKLAALRWMEGATVKSVTLTSEKIVILFHCGEYITILNKNGSQGECPWEIFESGYEYTNICWSVVCDEGEIYYNIPV